MDHSDRRKGVRIHVTRLASPVTSDADHPHPILVRFPARTAFFILVSIPHLRKPFGRIMENTSIRYLCEQTQERETDQSPEMEITSASAASLSHSPLILATR
jgi:hypothetical protein